MTKRLTKKQRKALMEKLVQKLPEEWRIAFINAWGKFTEKQQKLVLDALVEAHEDLALVTPTLKKIRVAG